MECFDKTMKIINDSISSIHEDEFISLKRDCIDTLNSGFKIITSGLGKNVPICEKFVGTLTSLGIPSAFMHTNSAVHGDLGIVQNGDLVIILTKSGETVESVYLVELLKKRNCKIWLLSFNRKSSLYKSVPNHVIIEMSHEGDPWNVLPNNSTVLNLIVLQELAMMIAYDRKIPLDALRMNHPGGNIGNILSVGK